MKYILLILFNMFIGKQIFAQELFLHTSKNYSQFLTDNQNANLVLVPANRSFSVANSYELGYLWQSASRKTGYSISAIYDAYDLNYALNETAFQYQWKLHYLGIKNAFQWQLYRSGINHKGPFSLQGKLGATLSSFMAGSLESQGKYLDLYTGNDFNKFYFQPSAGLQFEYQVIESVKLMGGYQYSTGNVISNPVKKFSLATHSLSFGIQFPIKK